MRTINDIPQMGLGTAKRTGAAGRAIIEAAIEIGYRHLDTAQDYNNELECGQAVAASGLPRRDFFLVTKISTSNLGPGQLLPSLHRSLEALAVDQLDLLLIHWPARYDEYELSTYMHQLAEARNLDLAQRVGVSNFPISYIDRSREILGDGALVNNQVEVHPYLQNRKLIAHCKSHGIAMTCYMPIAGGKVATDPDICRIADKHGSTPAAVALAYLMALDLIVVPSSTREERLRANFESTQLELDAEDRARMAALDRGERLIVRDWGPVFD